MGNLIFAAGNAQLDYPLPALRKAEEIIVTFGLELTVAPGDYTFTVNVSEPSDEGGPNAGCFHDVHESLGPLTVTADQNKVYPFYGMAKLSMRISHSTGTEH